MQPPCFWERPLQPQLCFCFPAGDRDALSSFRTSTREVCRGGGRGRGLDARGSESPLRSARAPHVVPSESCLHPSASPPLAAALLSDYSQTPKNNAPSYV